MKAVVSTTYDDKYLFFLPIITYCWNKLGVQVVCFMPGNNIHYTEPRLSLISNTAYRQNLEWEVFNFYCPEHKEATYAQCSRLYAAALPEIERDEVLISSDIDMAVFKNNFSEPNGFIWNLGFDLVPEGQLPMCYTWGPAYHWSARFDIKGKSLQECLDEQLAHEDCENMRGNLWSRDQELLKKAFEKHNYEGTIRVPRARPGTQFANYRVDRDDINWRSYLGPDLIDAHLWRPGYTEENFANILELLQTQYPEDNFQWMIDYRNEYINIL